MMEQSREKENSCWGTTTDSTDP